MSREALALVRLTIPEADAAPLEQVEAYVAQALRNGGFNVARVNIEWLSLSPAPEQEKPNG